MERSLKKIHPGSACDPCLICLCYLILMLKSRKQIILSPLAPSCPHYTLHVISCVC
jgi:hypothetical protein